jgi:hypothetical protein
MCGVGLALLLSFVHGKPNKQQQKSHDVFFMSMQKQTTTAESHDVFFISMEKQTTTAKFS